MRNASTVKSCARSTSTSWPCQVVPSTVSSASTCSHRAPSVTPSAASRRLSASTARWLDPAPSPGPACGAPPATRTQARRSSVTARTSPACRTNSPAFSPRSCRCFCSSSAPGQSRGQSYILVNTAGQRQDMQQFCSERYLSRALLTLIAGDTQPNGAHIAGRRCRLKAGAAYLQRRWHCSSTPPRASAAPGPLRSPAAA